MGADLVFEDPPAEAKIGTSRLVKNRLAPLRERPGEWARVYGPATGSNSYRFASQLRTGKTSGIPAGEFDTQVGELEDGWYVWARYIGSPNSNGAGE